jgi:GMP synthase (glutamine-hydrolysing)
MSKNVTFFIHDKENYPRRLGAILEEYGFDEHLVFTPHENVSAIDSIAPDLLVLMGGPMGVYEAATHPYLSEEITALRQRIRAGKPTLGICLGAQLIAAALGEKIYKGAQGFEIGWHPLSITDEGQSTAIRHLSGEHAHMFHWHQDTFNLPAGAVRLASSAAYENQAYSYGKHVMALQFHPEVVSEQAVDWTKDIKDEALRRETARCVPEYMPAMDRQFRLFMAEWLKQTGLLKEGIA